MYLKHWGLKEFPFENVPDPRLFYLSHHHEEALSRLLYAVKRKKGGAMLSGDIGCGKTTLTKVCIQELAVSSGSCLSIRNLRRSGYQSEVPQGLE